LHLHDLIHRHRVSIEVRHGAGRSRNSEPIGCAVARLVRRALHHVAVVVLTIRYGIKTIAVVPWFLRQRQTIKLPSA
jgi:hypothetical protein